MNYLRTIGPSDHGTVEEIIGNAYEILESMELPDLQGDEITPETVGISSVCWETSSAVTQAAHNVGVLASRETSVVHGFTSFGPLDRPPAMDDPVLCLTWGQFDREDFSTKPFNEFFGTRGDIVELVGQRSSRYTQVIGRQVTHAPLLPSSTHSPERSNPATNHFWLCTTPQEVATGSHPVGEVRLEDYPENMWTDLWGGESSFKEILRLGLPDILTEIIKR